MKEVDTVKYDHIIDIKGLCCSAPVLRLTKEFKGYSSGDVALVISNKWSMNNDIPAYCGMTKHELLKQEEKDGLFYFWVRKR